MDGSLEANTILPLNELLMTTRGYLVTASVVTKYIYIYMGVPSA